MGVRYFIDEAEYKDDVLNVKGWIFEGLEYNIVNEMQMVIITSGGLEWRCNLELYERADVSKAYNLKYLNVGFELKCVIKSFVSARVYLEYLLNEKKEVLDIIEIQGNKTDVCLERLEIEYLEIDGFYNINNFEKILDKKELKKEIDKKVDIILPVYNGFEYLERLFTSLYYTEIEMRIIVINDYSSDQRIDDYMNELCEKKDNIIYLKNTENLGFVKSVNKGLEIAQNDVVLVNTDIEVPEGWLERLMYPIFSDASIASTTPYTNCGTICSFPEMGKDNVIFDNRTLFFVDSVFRNMYPHYTEVPTGVGFCMGMSLKAIKEVGLLDEKNFGKGYGEENDWCQRAIEKGYRNVHIENLFVYHKHGGSFTTNEKMRLLEENTKNLLVKHPNYMKDVGRYFENDTDKVYRKYALFQCLMQIQAPTSLFFNHSLGGGANDYLLLRKEELHKANEKCIEFAYNVHTNNFQVKINYKDYELKLFSNSFNKLMNKLELSDINTIYINELVTYPKIYSVLHAILAVKHFCKAKLIMLGHDFFSICPTINLLKNDGKYCYLQCETNTACLQENKYLSDSCCKNINVWRNKWKEFLIECDSIIVFSNISKNIFEKVYGKLENVKVIPHVTSKMLEIKKRYKITPNINIGILGVLSDRKGLNIVKEMLHQISDRSLPVNIVLIGTSEEDISGEHCIITGQYKREQLPRLMYLYDIDIVFIASVWPETFSYTTEEAIKMHMPVAAFDLGAPAERLRKYDKSIIIDNLKAETAINRIWGYAQDNACIMKKNFRILFIIEYISFSARYRVEHLREYLAYAGIASDLVFIDQIDLKKICKYNAVSIYRCSDVDMVEKIADITNQEKIMLLYDIDDFIFEYEKIEYLDFLKTDEYKDYEKYCFRIRRCMELCDALTTSTVTLANEIRNCFPTKKTIVCRNVACLEMQLLSEIAIEKCVKDSKDIVVLGYFSGSATHNKDWLLIEDAVIKVMKSNDNVELLLVGVLETGSKLLEFGHRVRIMSFVDWRLLPKLLRSIDINLMPLENELFHKCKSENKWMEAGLVGVPTIASRNSELDSVLEDGKNVIFCENEEEWYLEITKLVNDCQLREFVGDNAKKEVYATHLITSESNFVAFMDVLNVGC